MQHKRLVRQIYREAMLDYYEPLKAAGMPHWYVRLSPTGPPISAVTPTPRTAWESAYSVVRLAAKKKPAQQKTRRVAPPAKFVKSFDEGEQITWPTQ